MEEERHGSGFRIPFRTTAAQARRLRQRLAMERPMTSLIERALLAETDELEWVRENWIGMWIDRGHAVTFDSGRVTAYRGISDRGELMWFVRHEDKKHGYHSKEPDPLAAVEEAEAAWAARREGRQRWDEVRQCAADLRAGRRKLEVRIEDAYASALCGAGIEAFLRSIGMGRVRRVSGRTAGLMMLLEEQVGFVILAAMDRERREGADAGLGLAAGA